MQQQQAKREDCQQQKGGGGAHALCVGLNCEKVNEVYTTVNSCR